VCVCNNDINNESIIIINVCVLLMCVILILLMCNINNIIINVCMY